MGVFLFAIEDYWRRCRRDEATLSLSDLTTGAGSPGQVFKLPEDDIRTRLSKIHDLSDGIYTYKESAMFEQLQRNDPNDEFEDLLSLAYDTEVAHV